MSWKLFSRKKKSNTEKWNARTMFGPNLNFTSTEAYKLLRTNIMFSFPDEGQCHVVGITSSIQDEGKSTTALNTAYALAEAGAKVLLLDGDLRRPTVASKLILSKTPGLSNLLVARGDYKEAVQRSAIAPELDVITSGDASPNPSELLGSNRMEKLMEQMKADYEYIIVDLPPVNVVSDAVAISKMLDGVVLVVRGGVSEQRMLSEALRQLNMVSVRILGFVYRDTDSSGKKHGRKYSKKYYKYYRDYEKKTMN